LAGLNEVAKAFLRLRTAIFTIASAQGQSPNVWDKAGGRKPTVSELRRAYCIKFFVSVMVDHIFIQHAK